MSLWTKTQHQYMLKKSHSRNSKHHNESEHITDKSKYETMAKDQFQFTSVLFWKFGNFLYNLAVSGIAMSFNTCMLYISQSKNKLINDHFNDENGSQLTINTCMVQKN